MNRIAEILKEKGITEMIPSDEILRELDIRFQSWNKFVSKKKDPNFFQIPIIAKFLGVEIKDLFPERSESLRSKHGFL